MKVDANGMAIADDSTSDDDFGDQEILQSAPSRPRAFAFSADTAVYYTDNAALTPHDTIDDIFFVANAGFSWSPLIAPRLGAQIIAHASTFRYDSTSDLDFTTFGLGAGLSWAPENFADIGLFARYDFIEMFDRHANEFLQDHELTIGAQRGFRLAPNHNLVTGIILGAGLSDPKSAQRDQAALFLDYQWQITRAMGFDVLYRFGGYFYNDPSRTDRNQILSATLHYTLWGNTGVNAFFSFADNRSDDSAFDYRAVSTGGGLSAFIQF